MAIYGVVGVAVKQHSEELFAFYRVTVTVVGVTWLMVWFEKKRKKRPIKLLEVIILNVIFFAPAILIFTIAEHQNWGFTTSGRKNGAEILSIPLLSFC